MRCTGLSSANGLSCNSSFEVRTILSELVFVSAPMLEWGDGVASDRRVTFDRAGLGLLPETVLIEDVAAAFVATVDFVTVGFASDFALVDFVSVVTRTDNCDGCFLVAAGSALADSSREGVLNSGPDASGVAAGFSDASAAVSEVSVAAVAGFGVRHLRFDELRGAVEALPALVLAAGSSPANSGVATASITHIPAAKNDATRKSARARLVPFARRVLGAVVWRFLGNGNIMGVALPHAS